MKLSVVAPTFNERQNVRQLVKAVGEALIDIPYEIVIVDDDSPDRTWQVVEELSASDPRVRVLRRTENHGLGTAVIDGFKAAEGEYVACMDGDLQHDPAELQKMLRQIDYGADLVVGSRYMSGGGTGNWSWFRRLDSWIATKMAQLFLGVTLSDPMSGYFMMRRSDFLRVRPQLKGEGFKILLEILIKLRPKLIEEVPYTFRARVNGKSKMSSRAVFQYLGQLWELSGIGAWLPGSFLKFALVGGVGIVVNLLVLASLLRVPALRGWAPSAVASLVANISNYGLNNIWTFSDRVHRGLGLIKGYASYLVMSTVGLGVTTVLYAALIWSLTQFPFWRGDQNVVGSTLLCQLIAITPGAWVNYILSKAVIWPIPIPDRIKAGENMAEQLTPSVQTADRLR